MSDYSKIYRENADLYDELVSAEDADGQLPAALAALCELSGAKVVEAGAGTGRMTRLLLAAGVAQVLATEIEPNMLKKAEQALKSYGARVEFAVADARALPACDGQADLSIAGWVFGHFRSWMPEGWQGEVGQAVNELERATRAGGVVVVVETLGTGYEEPTPPVGLAEYYSFLEKERGFTRQVLRTDYEFASVDAAARITGAFFGDEFAERVRANQWTRVPECTGLWSRTLPAEA